MRGQRRRRRLRLRIRRKRKGGSFASQVAEGARNAAGDAAAEAALEGAGEVVYQTGWCLLEAVVSASAVLALLTVPAYLLITRVT